MDDLSGLLIRQAYCLTVGSNPTRRTPWYTTHMNTYELEFSESEILAAKYKAHSYALLGRSSPSYLLKLASIEVRNDDERE